MRWRDSAELERELPVGAVGVLFGENPLMACYSHGAVNTDTTACPATAVRRGSLRRRVRLPCFVGAGLREGVGRDDLRDLIYAMIVGTEDCAFLQNYLVANNRLIRVSRLWDL